jgi:hypothetical protein
MTDYVDIPTVTTLHGEQERTQQAIDLLAAGGTMTSFTVAPPSVPSGAASPPNTMMMSVQISVTEPISEEMVTALNDWLTTRQQNIIDELAIYDVGPPPPPVTDPPVNTLTPVATQDVNNLTCTTGNWNNSPTSFTYQWSNHNGPVMGATYPSYAITFNDVGVGFTCTVTAINNIGSTVAPLSNNVVVVAPS